MLFLLVVCVVVIRVIRRVLAERGTAPWLRLCGGNAIEIPRVLHGVRFPRRNATNPTKGRKNGTVQDLNGLELSRSPGGLL